MAKVFFRKKRRRKQASARKIPKSFRGGYYGKRNDAARLGIEKRKPATQSQKKGDACKTQRRKEDMCPSVFRKRGE